MRRIAALAAIVALIASVTVGPDAPAEFRPHLGKYVASVPGSTAATNVLKIEVIKRAGTRRVRLLRAVDDCAAGFFSTPMGLGRLTGQSFELHTGGVSNTASYSIDLDGRFTSATGATATVRSSETQNFPPPGTPPGMCSDDTTFTLRHLKPTK